MPSRTDRSSIPFASLGGGAVPSSRIPVEDLLFAGGRYRRSFNPKHLEAFRGGESAHPGRRMSPRKGGAPVYIDEVRACAS
jgi:hypothetical protein